jgi:hypothetical protein
MTTTLACREVGLFDCDEMMRGETEEGVLRKGAEHGRPICGMTDEQRAMTASLAEEECTMTMQRTEGEGKAPEHTHPARTHSHDHYHVSHHHRGGVLAEWDHRTAWHSHEHNHHVLRHSHDYSDADEEQEHGKEAHVHDHAAPVGSSA